MARRDLSRTDASDFERRSLEYVLDKGSKEADGTRYVSVEEAINEESVLELTSDRDVTRVLFISRDESLLNPSQQSLDGYIDIADLFDEVHIMILRQGIPTKTPVIRVRDNVWIYTATHPLWWATAFAGFRLVRDQLVFAEGFRTDIIVARDPFESAALGLYLSHKYNRPLQVHVLESFYTKEFLSAAKPNRWRKLLASKLLKKIKSVRVSTRVVHDELAKKFKFLDLAVLPRLNSYENMITAPSTIELRDKYKPFVFIMLYVGSLKYESAFVSALDAARFGLRNPHLGMIVIGKGPAKSEFEKRAEILQVRPQVVFETGSTDVLSYLKSANVLLVPDTDAESEEVVLMGAAAGIPMIVARTPAREDIFKDGESVLFFEAGNIDEISLKLNLIMNDIILRRQLVETAQEIIRTRFHEDPTAYKKAYRSSIEQVLFLEEVKQSVNLDKAVSELPA
jgi:glycosyltransferase involved in cell wall biosynthesis